MCTPPISNDCPTPLEFYVPNDFSSFFFFWAQIGNLIAKKTQNTTNPAETTQPSGNQ